MPYLSHLMRSIYNCEEEEGIGFWLSALILDSSSFIYWAQAELSVCVWLDRYYLELLMMPIKASYRLHLSIKLCIFISLTFAIGNDIERI